MLVIKLPSTELFDHSTQEFTYLNGKTIQMEHSLVSISKWESEWKKPFMSETPRSRKEALHYYVCMTITQNVTMLDFASLTPEIEKNIDEYINSSMTATILPPPKKKAGKKPVITSELIYSWMIAHKIPFECQKWHLNRLITLIQLCGEQNAPSKKETPQEIAERHRRINEANRLKYRSRG